MVFQKSACIEPMYQELPFLDRFQAAKRDGFDFVEFWSWTDKDLDAVKAAARSAGVGISGFNGDAELSLVDPSQKEAYLAFMMSRRRPIWTSSAGLWRRQRRWGPGPSPSIPTAWERAAWSLTTMTASATP